jgi:hypothetical protein
VAAGALGIVGEQPVVLGEQEPRGGLAGFLPCWLPATRWASSWRWPEPGGFQRDRTLEVLCDLLVLGLDAWRSPAVGGELGEDLGKELGG